MVLRWGSLLDFPIVIQAQHVPQEFGKASNDHKDTQRTLELVLYKRAILSRDWTEQDPIKIPVHVGVRSAVVLCGVLNPLNPDTRHETKKFDAID